MSGTPNLYTPNFQANNWITNKKKILDYIYLHFGLINFLINPAKNFIDIDSKFPYPTRAIFDKSTKSESELAEMDEIHKRSSHQRCTYKNLSMGS